MPPAPATSGDDELMVAALIQFAVNKLDAKQYARDLYHVEDPTRAQVESARLRWKGCLKRLEEKTGRAIVAATPKKETGGATAKRSGNVKKRKAQIEEEDMGDEGETAVAVATPTPSPKKMKKSRGAGKVKEEDVAFATGGFWEERTGDGLVAGHGGQFSLSYPTYPQALGFYG